MQHLLTSSPQADIVLSRLLNCFNDQQRNITRQVAVNLKVTARNPAVTPFGMVISQDYCDRLVSSFNTPRVPAFSLAAAAHAHAHYEFSNFFNPVERLKDLSLAVIALVEDARVEEVLNRLFPRVRTVFSRFLLPSIAQHMIGVEGQLAQLAVALHLKSDPFDNYLCTKALLMFDRLLEMPSHSSDHKIRAFNAARDIGSILANDLGQLRYRFDRSRYSVWPSYRDDNSGLWSDQKADDLVQEAISQGQNRSKSESEISGLEELQDTLFYYDEWDESENKYRIGFVTVRHRGVISRQFTNKRLLYFSPELTSRSQSFPSIRGDRYRYVDNGDDLYLDRALQRHLDLWAGADTNNKIYRTWSRKRIRTGVTLLLDASESANDRIPGTFLSVLDVEKQALISLADQFGADSVPFGIASFHSNSNKDVFVNYHKGFLDYWSHQEREGIRKLNATLSTRMGASLRHVGAISGRLFDQMIVVVITDGEPSDIDQPLSYFHSDTRRAVIELKEKNIGVFCLKIGEDRAQSVASIFGESNLFCVKPNALSVGLSQLLKRLRKNFV